MEAHNMAILDAGSLRNLLLDVVMIIIKILDFFPISTITLKMNIM